MDEAQARGTGLTNQAIASQLNTALAGSAGGSILDGTRDIPVRVRVPEETPGQLECHRVAGNGHPQWRNAPGCDLIPDPGTRPGHHQSTQRSAGQHRAGVP